MELQKIKDHVTNELLVEFVEKIMGAKNRKDFKKPTCSFILKLRDVLIPGVKIDIFRTRDDDEYENPEQQACQNCTPGRPCGEHQPQKKVTETINPEESKEETKPNLQTA